MLLQSFMPSDGSKPKCGNCVRLRIQCSWGVKASFHPSRQLGLTTSDQLHLSAIEKRRDAATSSSGIVDAAYKIVDKTNDIIRWCQGDRESSPLPESEFDGEHDSSSSHHQDPCDSDTPLPPFVESDTTFSVQVPSIAAPSFAENAVVFPVQTSRVDDGLGSPRLPDHHSASLPSLPITTEDLSWLETCPLPFSLGLAASRTASPTPEVPLPIPEKDVVFLLTCYLAETATWCETTDSARHFSTLCTHDLVENKIFQGSALALARRQLSMVGRGGESVALRLYQYTIQVLIQQDPEEAGAAILAACTLLCVFEMMASDVINWRRHLKGCTAFFLARGWNGSSSGLIKTCFWAFARIDIWAAFVLKKPTLIPTDHWVNDESLENAANHEYPDDYCNLMIHIFAKILNCLYLSPNSGSHSKSSQLGDLWSRIQQWWSERPKSVLPIYRSTATEPNPFPVVLFASSSSICGTSFYHAASILILKELPALISAGHEAADPIWHAREVCGISISNNDHANWVNHLHPLFMAGEVFATEWEKVQDCSTSGPLIQRNMPSTGSPESPYATYTVTSDTVVSTTNASGYSAEKIALLQHLIRIQRETGWSTEGRAKQLRRLWGLE